MAHLVPVSFAVVEPGWAERVVSPPHDALTPTERWAHLRANPHSYLGVTRSVDDLAPGDRSSAAEVLERCRASLEVLRSVGAFGPQARPGLALYRLSRGGHSQIGVVGATTVADHTDRSIRVHEAVHAARAAALADHVSLLRVQSSPIALARRPDPAPDAVVAEAEAAADPMVDLRTPDGLHQQVRPVLDPDLGAALAAGLERHPFYVIDGHHRAEAARLLREADRSPGAGLVLSVVFPSDQLVNRSFPRCLLQVDPHHLLDELGRRFRVRAATAAEVARRPAGDLALLAAGGWHLVTVPPADGDWPTGYRRLDAVRLQHRVLGPVLGIDPSDPAGRLSYLPPGDATDDRTGLEALAGRGAGEGCGAVWVLRPVPVPVLLDVADAGLVLPPKSTYFEPKVRSGVFLRDLG